MPFDRLSVIRDSIFLLGFPVIVFTFFHHTQRHNFRLDPPPLQQYRYVGQTRTRTNAVTGVSRLAAQGLLSRPSLLWCRNFHEYVSRNESKGVRNITLNHPKTRNSLSLEMMSALIETINLDKNDVNLRAIVLSSNGLVFSAGHNLKELHSSTGIQQHKNIFEMATELMKSVLESPVPVIAKVNGLAAAAGCQLVATCDMIICSDKSKFSTPGANFGIFCSTPGIAVGRSVPKSRALYMLLTGEPITAQEAYESGLVTKVVAESDLDATVEEIIDKIKLKSRSVIATGKEFYYKQISLGLSDAYKLGEQKMVENVNMEDGQEGIQSFIDKRKATWSHRA